MVTATNRLRSYLDTERLPYEVVHHRPDYTAQQTAQDTATPGREFAKVVVVRLDGKPTILVLPAHHRVNFQKLHASTHAHEAVLCEESDLSRLFPDCDLGAEPPFGNLYGLPVIVSAALSTAHSMTFNAGSHEDAVRMMYLDFERVVKPAVLDFSDPV
ncbi:MAG: YbaK/EbsC family protein [Planctomycetes bacterium]|nr:YbaK/EbsC family protein [Planctomycetota bacterium]